jgi:cation transporter-like permease
MSGLKWITVVVIGFLAASVVVVVIGLAGIQVESSTLGGLHLILWFLFGWGLSRTFASRPQAQVDIESSTNTSAIEPAFPADPDRETRDTLLPRSKDVEAANTPTTPEPVMVRAHLSGWRIALGVLVVLIVAAGASFGGYRFALIPDTTTIPGFH